MSTMMAALNAASIHLPGHMWGPGPGFGWWFLLIPLFWIGVVALIVGIFGRRWRRSAAEGEYGRSAPARQAESTLAERFAQGDIDEVEYRARLEVLRANAARPV